LARKLPLSTNQQTLGEGPFTGQEVIFSFSISPDLLPADHYFFVPQVQLSDGEFMWLSAPKPIVSGTPFTPDLQAWIRNEELAPDWLRVGTDIVGGSPAPTFNASFSLDGVTATPEPSSLLFPGGWMAGHYPVAAQSRARAQFGVGSNVKVPVT